MVAKPCPFCGMIPTVNTRFQKCSNGMLYWVWCDNSNCDINPGTTKYFSEDKAIEAWNRRMDNTQINSEIERYGEFHEQKCDDGSTERIFLYNDKCDTMMNVFKGA